MSNYVIGTAGHIDHGKTALVKALSGVNTDTLKEEQKRGITVNLGFTYFKVGQKEVGIIDVPGHEKLIKNMLAGVFGIDLVLLVVAADDGIMPQTREHYEIIKFLGIQNVLTVITKTDLVDPERVEEVKLEVAEEFGLTDFALFSIYDDQGISDEIEKRIVDKPETDDTFFRMPIDRVFSIKGVGTVITGTSLSGSVSIGDTLEVIPGNEVVRVKGIQVHKKPVERAEKHMRVALNINKADLHRGKIIATPKQMQPTKILDCSLTMSEHTKQHLKHLERIKLYYFSEELTARVKLFNQKQVSKGEKVYCQLLLDEEVFASKHDRGIIRKVNPNITIAGVEILNELGEYASRKDDTYKERIGLYAAGETSKLVEDYLIQNVVVHSEDLRKKEFDISEVPEANFVKVENYYIHNANLCTLEEQTVIILDEFHQENKYTNGMNKQELKNRLGIDVKSRVLNGILDLFEDVEYKDIVKLKSFEISLTKEEEELRTRILDYLGTTFKPPKYNDIYMYFQSKEFENVFFSLVKKNEIIRIDEDIFLSKAQLDRMIEIYDRYFETNEVLDLASARNVLDTSRRYVVPYLEYLDKIGYTSRKENGRIKRK